jgi:hypothetical protein
MQNRQRPDVFKRLKLWPEQQRMPSPAYDE